MRILVHGGGGGHAVEGLVAAPVRPLHNLPGRLLRLIVGLGRFICLFVCLFVWGWDVGQTTQAPPERRREAALSHQSPI